MSDLYLNEPDYTAGTDNATVTRTYAANSFASHLITQIHAAYNGDPTSGSLMIVAGGETRYVIPVTKSGPAPIYFDPPFVGRLGEAVTVTLAPGGSGITGYLNVWHFLK